MRKERLRTLSYAVMLYMLLAFSWWAVLLYQKNEDVYHAKSELLRYNLTHQGQYVDELSFLSHPEHEFLIKKRNRQKAMIFGEVGVFVLSLLLGMWFIHRGYRKEVETANEKQNFLLSITHELKSPLASLRIALETIKNRTLKKEQVEMLTSNGLEDIDRLQSLVENLLFAARVETNYEPVFEEINVRDVLTRSIEFFKARYPSFAFNLTAVANPKIRADRTGLISMVYNLIENAIKYSLEDQVIDISLEETKSGLSLKIADRGVGIPKEEQEKIFDRFYRIGSEDVRQTKGTGLGLYIVHQIVHAHSWKINVLNNIPRGTIFQINIPSS